MYLLALVCSKTGASIFHIVSSLFWANFMQSGFCIIYIICRAPGIRLGTFHGVKAKRETELAKLQKHNGVVLTTYGKHFYSLSY